MFSPILSNQSHLKLKIHLFLVTSLPANFSYADRYGVYDDPEFYGSGSGFFSTIGILILTLMAYGYLYSSFSKWRIRKTNECKDDTIEYSWDFFIFLCIKNAVISIFIAFPAVMLVKSIGGVSSVNDYWLQIWVMCGLIVTFLELN